jgi:MFS family permease
MIKPSVCNPSFLPVADSLTHILDHNAPGSNIEIVSWNGPKDPENPYNWPLRQKWTLTYLAAFATFITMMNGTIITVAHAAINEEFGISDENFPHSYWPVTSWAVGGGCFSLLILPLMEEFGVRWVFLLAYVAFVCFVIPQALAQNFATLIVTRFFAGGCVSILANTSATVIGNVWDTEKARNIPVSLYIVTYLVGASIGPVIGAPIFEFLSWRWISYLQLIWLCALFPLYFFLFKECRGIAILGKRAKALRKEGRLAYTQHEIDSEGTSMMRIVARSATRPLLLFFTESVVFVSFMWSAFTVGTLYLFTQSVEQVFVGLYDWTPSQAGYIQAAIVVGEFLGWVGTLFSGKIYFDSAARNTEVPGTPIPEARLYLAIVGGVLGISGGMFTYAWTSYANFPWIAPAVGLAMVGAGSVIVVTGISDYVVDAYAKYAASAVGIIVTGENTFSAFLPLAAMSMYNTLGFQWASTLLAFISLALSFAPILFVVYGKQIRERSPFMKEAMLEKRRKSFDSSV